MRPGNDRFHAILTAIQTALNIETKPDDSVHDCVKPKEQGLHILTMRELDDAHDKTLTPEVEEQLQR